MRKPTRAEDDRLLSMLSLRGAASARAVGDHFGLTPEYVRTALNRVKQEDVSQARAGRIEDPAAVAAFYQWGQ